ncbi:MAG: hypothetical protein A2Z99_06015 [Treponema sp. GWB1_62_6]|nr:MAG: hypothetical protein A2001_01210 [Treponema sp. GWC1_61_84]OHE65146.1 MAG: hypothetical protein A2Y36_17000 [Treponema sp. GWA1_62_8]OHE70494.1 MAG: hypothetical protein A2413_19500 [Treponema sp. RIFOXYC1_FULL_61_9]OHE72074.1 MAG: hypothetical protein A2Z99_06015 [Treponema sp. GWB1_62_6]HCM27940.1 hypothetical protein [Treponema sp.]
MTDTLAKGARRYGARLGAAEPSGSAVSRTMRAPFRSRKHGGIGAILPHGDRSRGSTIGYG